MNFILSTIIVPLCAGLSGELSCRAYYLSCFENKRAEDVAVIKKCQATADASPMQKRYPTMTTDSTQACLSRSGFSERSVDKITSECTKEYGAK
ncbi:MAG: hypothetical protein V4568_14690 [Pseudomonadota bacterium]